MCEISAPFRFPMSSLRESCIFPDMSFTFKGFVNLPKMLTSHFMLNQFKLMGTNSKQGENPSLKEAGQSQFQCLWNKV